MGTPLLGNDWNINFIFAGSCILPLLVQKLLRGGKEHAYKVSKTLFLLFLLANLLTTVAYPQIEAAFVGRPVLFAALVLSSVFFLSFGSWELLENKNKSRNWWASIVAIGSLGLALFLRLYDLEGVDSFRDEDHHIYGAKTLIESDYLLYGRAKLVTYSTAFMAQWTEAETFHEYLYAGRIPGAVLGALSTIPIYLLAKKINYSTGAIAAFLWAVSPWAIGVSHNIREHSFYLFFILIAILSFYRLLERHLKEGKGLDFTSVINILFLGALLFYAFFIDRFSTLKVAGAILGSMTLAFVFVHTNMWKRSLKDKRVLLGIAATLALFTGLILRVKHIRFLPQADWGWPDTFFHAAASIPMHWWQADTQDPYLFYCLLLAAWTGIIYYKKRKTAFFFFSFFFVLSAYFLFFNRYYFPRYIFYILPLFVIFIAAAVQTIWQFWELVPNKIKWIGRFCTLVLLLFIFKYQNTWAAATNPGENEIHALKSTGEFHHDKEVALKYIGNKFINTHIDSIAIVSSIYDYLIYHEFEPTCVIKYQYKAPDRISKLEELADSLDQGIVLLDKHRNEIWQLGLPVDSLQRPFRFASKEMRLVVNENRCQIYEWYPMPAPLNLRKTSKLTDGILDANKRQSFSFWIKPETLNDGPLFYVSKGAAEYPMITARVRNLNTGKIRLTLEYDRYDPNSISYIDIPRTDEWQHIVWYQYSGQHGSPQGFFLNGLKGHERKTPFTIEGLGRIFIDKNAESSIKDLKIYDQVLTEPMITPIYREGKNLEVPEFQKQELEFKSANIIEQ